MSKLMCSAGKCLNNLQGFCTASAIEVENNESESECKTFASKGEIETMSKFHNENLTKGFEQMISGDNEMSPEVNCEVYDCIYNENRNCVADSVEIDGDNATTTSETICSTYRKQ